MQKGSLLIKCQHSPNQNNDDGKEIEPKSGHKFEQIANGVFAALLRS